MNMHPALRKMLSSLAKLREDAGYSVEEVADTLVLGPGWVERWESGEIEPSIGTLIALLDLYGADPADFFTMPQTADSPWVLDRRLVAEELDDGLKLLFPMGPFSATVKLPGATLDEFAAVQGTLRPLLAQGLLKEAIVETFFHAVETWPDANPSDLWYFFLAHAYQDDFNHPARLAGRDWAQSWKRASGWALEQIVVRHYNAFLKGKGVRLEMPDPARKRKLLSRMQIEDLASLQKADVLAVGTKPGGGEECFGVIHVKASLAERRTDDAPLSQILIQRGYLSPLVTMDCKATPSSRPVNRGELGSLRGGAADVTPKRLDIEQDKKFDACFSFNANTKPTPAGQAASARIYVCDFRNANDRFSQHILRRWSERQGLD